MIILWFTSLLKKNVGTPHQTSFVFTAMNWCPPAMTWCVKWHHLTASFSARFLMTLSYYFWSQRHRIALREHARYYLQPLERAINDHVASKTQQWGAGDPWLFMIVIIYTCPVQTGEFELDTIYICSWFQFVVGEVMARNEVHWVQLVV